MRASIWPDPGAFAHGPDKLHPADTFDGRFMSLSATTNLLRSRGGHEAGRVTFVELFFDLVFVFAITQLSHSFLAHLTPLGALETLILLVAVWWVWINTSWCTNWLDPQTTPVRLMLFALMLGGLVVSTSIPQAFSARGWAFALAFAAMQIGSPLFMLWATRERDPGNYRNFQRIAVWRVIAAILWVAGACVEGHARLAIWAVALLIESIAPANGYYVPGLGRSVSEDWKVEGGHIAERCGLFIILSLGESVLVIGATFSEQPWTAATVAAFVSSFVGSVTLWWIYFNVGAEKGTRAISESGDPGRLARLAYTYLHIPIVAGIIVCAVADELVLAHPGGHTDLKTALAVVGGPALYLIGNIVFKHSLWGRMPLSHLVGLGLLALHLPAAAVAPPLALGIGTTLVLVIVAAWETRSLGPRSHSASVDSHP